MGLHLVRTRCAILAQFLVVAGCSKSEKPAGIDVRPVYPVKGVVTLAGKPIGGAIIGFRPLAGRESVPYNPRAVSMPDGTFTLTTYVTGDGAPPGDYLVTIYWPSPGSVKNSDGEDEAGSDPPDRLGKRYLDPKTSPLRATVTVGENTVDFKLP